MTYGSSLVEYLRRSDRLIAENDWDAEAALIREALSVFPEEAELWIRYALSVHEDAPERAACYANRAARLAMNDPGMLTRCASLLFDLERFDDARRYVKALVPRASDGFPLIPDVLHLVGKLAAQKGNDEVAEQYLAQAFEADPSTTGHALVLAEFLTSQGRDSDALHVIARGLEHGAKDRSELVVLQDRVLGA